MTMGLYRLDGHTPVRCDDIRDWAATMERDRTVRRDVVGDVQVSTVFLGIDHNWWEGPPLLFETMVFGGPLDEETERYSTWDEAEAGHAAMLARVLAAK